MEMELFAALAHALMDQHSESGHIDTVEWAEAGPIVTVGVGLYRLAWTPTLRAFGPTPAEAQANEGDQ